MTMGTFGAKQGLQEQAGTIRDSAAEGSRTVPTEFLVWQARHRAESSAVVAPAPVPPPPHSIHEAMATITLPDSMPGPAPSAGHKRQHPSTNTTAASRKVKKMLQNGDLQPTLHCSGCDKRGPGMRKHSAGCPVSKEYNRILENMS